MLLFFHEHVQEIKKVGKDLGIAPTIIRDEELKTRGFGGGWGLVLAGLDLRACSGHLAGGVAVGTWYVVPSFTPKETGLCPTPRPGPGKQTVTGEKEAVVQVLIQILEAVGSKASPACSLSGLLTCCPDPRASSSGPFCSSNTHSHVHTRALYY